MSQNYPFQVKQLPYSYISFSPYFNPNTLYLHHNKYYMQQVQRLNQLVVKHRLTDHCLEELLFQDINLPTAQLNELRGTAGAVYNHVLFFDSTQCTAGNPPLNRLVGEILTSYGSIPRFKRLLVEAAQSLLGSGWVWLVVEKDAGLHIVITSNDKVVSLHALQPIFVIDVWEHAFFLDYSFDIEKYIDRWFTFIDWDKAEQRFLSGRPASFHP